jgi:hypothetical protein
MSAIESAGADLSKMQKQPSLIATTRHLEHTAFTATQKLNFVASCTSLGAAAFTTCPNVELLMLPSTESGP